MTENRPYSSQIAMKWWRATLRPEQDTGAAKAIRARLRRAGDVVSVLSEPAVVDLYGALGRKTDPHVLATVAQVLAGVKQSSPQRAARLFGAGDPKPLSPARFQRLIRCDDPAELSIGLRRALPLIGHACNVASLAGDLLHWGEAARINWCFDYYGAVPPADGGAGDGAAMEDDE